MKRLLVGITILLGLSGACFADYTIAPGQSINFSVSGSSLTVAVSPQVATDTTTLRTDLTTLYQSTGTLLPLSGSKSMTGHLTAQGVTASSITISGIGISTNSWVDGQYLTLSGGRIVSGTPAGGTGGYWIGTATSPLNMGNYNINSSSCISAPVFYSNGSVAAPAYSWGDGKTTGMYGTGTLISFASNGSERLRITDSSVLAAAGTATNPAYSFINNANSGMYSAGTDDDIVFSRVAKEKMRVTATGIKLGDVAISTYVWVSGQYLTLSGNSVVSGTPGGSGDMVQAINGVAIALATSTLRTDLTTLKYSTFTVASISHNLISSTGTLTHAQIETQFLTVGQTTATIRTDVTALQVNKVSLSTGVVGSLPLTGLGTGALSSSIYVSSQNVTMQTWSGGHKVIDDIDIGFNYSVLGSTTTAGTNVQPFFYRDYAVTLSTFTLQVLGGTSVTGSVEYRSAIGTAGTNIWSGTIIATTAITGGTFAQTSIPANNYLVFVPTVWIGAVNNVIGIGKATKQ